MNCGDAALYARLAAGMSEARMPALFEGEVALQARCARICDLLWDALSPRGVSWVGFYVIDPSTPLNRATRDGAMLLLARRDKPACSPIGLHGACGQAFLGECVRLVEDVALLGANYIACDPRDRSELVLPIYRNGFCIGVLDVDSHEPARFGTADIEGLSLVLTRFGLLDRTPPVEANCLHPRAVSL